MQSKEKGYYDIDIDIDEALVNSKYRSVLYWRYYKTYYAVQRRG